MAYRVSTREFEGPFDLLLYLVSRRKIDVAAISISEIADQYLAEIGRMRYLDLDAASDFLLVASTLLELKAASLIPSEAAEDIPDYSPSELRDALIEKLIVYKQFKNASAALAERMEAASRKHPRNVGMPQEFMGANPNFLQNISAKDLAAAAARLLGAREISLIQAEHIKRVHIPVEGCILAIAQMVASKHRLLFSDLIGSSPSTELVVANLLALLELYKRGSIDLTQESSFGDIAISAKVKAPPMNDGA